jgi:hypothetical protein
MMRRAPGLGRAAERRVVALFLLVLGGVVLRHALAYWRGDEPLGADSSSHILASATLAEHLREGAPGWWMPHLNLGFPLAHFYQPLPHLATALLALALGGPEQATLAYKLWVVLLLCLAPLTTYVGLRRLELSRTAALASAIALATLSTRQESFGLTQRHYLMVGLYTLLWGGVFLPLALAEGVRFVQGRGRSVLAVGSFGLLFLSHGLLALGLIPLWGLVALLVPGEGGCALRGRCLRLVALGALSAAFLASWLLPQLMCSDYFNGWPIPMGELTVDGLGLGALFGEWLRGELLDLRRAPVLTALSVLGALAAALGARHRAAPRVVLIGLVLFFVFTAGRKTFGPVLDWVFPPNARIEGMLRWVAMLQFFLALAAGLGAELLALPLRSVRSLAARPWVPLALVAALELGLALPRHARVLALGLTTFPEAQDRPAFVRVAQALAAEPAGGRVYTREPLGHSSHWAMAYLTLLTGKPMTISYGVGGQDSLSFFYLWYLDLLDRERGPALARLFDIRYLLIQPGLALGSLPARFVARQGPYEVVRLEGEYGLFELIAPPEVMDETTPAAARAACLRWMRDEYPRGAPFLRLREPIAVKLPRLPSANLEYADRARARTKPRALAAPVRGAVLEEQAGLASFRARLRAEDEESWALLKVTPHPFWQAKVDGEPAPIYYLSPAFIGLPLARGEHEVVLTFRAPAWQKALLLLAPLLLAGLQLLDRRRAALARRAFGRSA